MLEFESPSLPHEEDSQSLILLVGIVAAQLDVPIRSVGSTTFRRRDLERGFEPNGSFYIQHEAEVRGRKEIDLGVHPPPDLIIEMEVSRSAIDKLALFAAMGFPEVWQSDGQRVTISIFDQGDYRTATRSAVLPILSAERLAHFLTASRESLSHEWFQTLSDWAREQRPPQ